MFRQKRFMIGGAVIAVAIGYLGFMGFQGSATYYYRVGELMELGSSAYGENVRVSGTIASGSIDHQAGSLIVNFGVAGDGYTLPVVYEGAVPDTFQEETDVVVGGHLGESGVFTADTIMMKCPSKYEPE